MTDGTRWAAVELRDAITRRRMERRTLPAPVDPAVLDELLDLARRAPTAGNAQGVDLVVLTDADRRAAIATAAGEDDYVERGFDPWLSVAPVHVVPCADVRRYRDRYREDDKDGPGPDGWPVPYWWMDLGAAVQNLLLLAVEADLAAGFLGEHAVVDLAGLLGLPDDVLPAGVLTLGHPHPDEPGPTRSARRPRRPLDDVVHREGW